jgi:hypothetical protein
MYTLDCEYYNDSFTTIALLVQAVIESGMDPSYEILKDGVGVGETVEDFIVH